MKIGFTGTQKGMTTEQKMTVADLLCSYSVSEAHHGDCVGADSEFHDVCHELQIKIVIHPPSNPRKRSRRIGEEIRPEKPYIERNHDIVNETEVLIAVPKEFEEQLRSGTWATVRYAYKVGRKIIVVFPDGSIDAG
jgi:hypothetical protein